MRDKDICVMGLGEREIKCDEGPQGGHRVAWDKVTPEQWEGFREILGTLRDRKVDVGALVGRDKVEKVWEDYVQGLDSTRGLFRKERVGRRNTKENKQFRDGLWGKKQELKLRKQDWERAVCDRQERGNVEVMEKYESDIQIRDEMNRMRDEEWRKRKSEYRLRVLGDGSGVEARFWKYRRSKRKRAGTRVLKKKGGGLAKSKTEIRWELEQHWRWLDQGVSIREGEGEGWERVPGGAVRGGLETSRLSEGELGRQEEGTGGLIGEPEKGTRDEDAEVRGDQLAGEIRLGEVRNVVRQASRRKAVGDDGIPNEFLKEGGK